MNILWQGARGPSVRTLQARLNDLGLSSVEVDGVYGPTTEAAIAAFQKERGVFADGMAGPQTLSLLGLGETASQPAPAPEREEEATLELDDEETEGFEELDGDGSASGGVPSDGVPASRSGTAPPDRTRRVPRRVQRRESRQRPSSQPERAQPHRNMVFVSYSHEDKKWLEMLQTHIAPLERVGLVNLWDDTDIAPGTRWGDAIRKAIASARVAVLLISPHFMASDYIATKELPPILAAAEGEGVLILPVIISPSWMGELQQFQTVNPPDEPLVDLRRGDRDRVWLRVVEAITEALNA